MTLRDSINPNSMYLNIRNSVSDSVFGSVYNSVWHPVHRAIRGNVWVCLDQKINKQL
jgi:hypothetical protein